MREVARDAALPLHAPRDAREVDLADLVRRELRPDALEGVRGARGEDESGGSRVDAVQDAGLERVEADDPAAAVFAAPGRPVRVVN